MLMLARRIREEIVVYTDDGLLITIGVYEMHGGQVKLGIDAPPHVHIDRKEIYSRKHPNKSPGA